MRGAPRYRCIGLKITFCLLLQTRGGAVPARAAVRSFSTRDPAREVHDSWAWVPVS
jgi:hypothetical protein